MNPKTIIKNLIQTCKNSWYMHFYYDKKLSSQLILIDSKSGIELGSNMLRIVEEINHNDYGKYRIAVVYQKNKKALIQSMLDNYQIRGVRLVKMHGLRYYRILGRAHFLFTDTSLPRIFMKKEGQIVTNTWHGTPLKKMGKKVSNRAYAIGNVQKNFLMTDYLVYPSDYMKEIMVKDYNLENLYQGKILLAGYPRNSIFYDSGRIEPIKEQLGLKGKRIYSYMPTWRGVMTNKNANQQRDQLTYYFHHLDLELTDQEVLLVRTHPFISNTIDYSSFRHIKPFPAQYDSYDILNISDCLVTDYSSVFFDFANSRKKIVLFVYDKDQYLDERGLYFSMDELPFPQVSSLDELLTEIRAPKNYNDQDFIKRFCTFDNPNGVKQLCRHILLGEQGCKEETLAGNGKENILLYTGSLAKNGLTTAVLNLFANIDMNKRNYFASFRERSLANFPSRVSILPEQVSIIPISSDLNYTIMEAFSCMLYFNKGKNSFWIQKYLERMFKREYQRHFGYGRFDAVIHYSGYEKAMINLFRCSQTKNAIFVHSDMLHEMESRHNQHYATLKAAYSEFTKVAVVTPAMLPPTAKISGRKDNIMVVSNCHAHKEVCKRAEQALSFDEDTQCTVSKEQLLEVLRGTSTKIITIGRYSGEKGHKMLIDAYSKYYEKNEDSYLIIIGGHGDIYRKTLAYAKSQKSSNHIILILSLMNPMPVLKYCDLFILSSLYEGLGLTLLEADTLQIPTIATDIPGPASFMQEHSGYLVPVSAEGIYEGMLAYDRGEVTAMNVDYGKYNQIAVAQFETLVDEMRLERGESI